MKKSILLLSILLLFLILLCIYQKAYLPYVSQQHRDSSVTLGNFSTLSTSNKSASIMSEKEKHSLATKIETLYPATAPLDSSRKEALILAVPKQKTPLQRTNAVEKKVISLSKSQLDTFEKPIDQQKRAINDDIVQNDIKEIYSLLQALRDREGALNNRDEFERYIENLIQRALSNRSVTITAMIKEEVYLQKLQKERLDRRDIAYDKIGKTNILRSGE